MTTRADIWAELKARLAAIPGVTVHPDRTTAVTRDEAPAIVMRRREVQRAMAGSQSERVMAVAVEVHTRNANIESAVAAAEAILVQVHAKLLATAPTNFDGALRIAYAGTDWTTESADQDACVVTATYEVTYRKQYQQF